MSKIHISYSRHDLKAVDGIIQELKSYGIELNYDKASSVGDAFAASITNAIAQCDAVIIFLSEASFNSTWCRKEWELADKIGKPIILICIDNFDSFELPLYLRIYKAFEYVTVRKRPYLLVEEIQSIVRRTSRTIENDRLPSPAPMPTGSNRKRKIHLSRPNLNWLWVILTVLLIIALFVLFGSRIRTANYSNAPSYQQQLEAIRVTNIILGIALVVLLATTIVLTRLYRSSRRKVKRLNTYLQITSDAKLQAQIGGSSMLIQEGKEQLVRLPLGIQKMDLDYATFNTPKRINCFIAGSTDLQAERDALRATISVVYNQWQKKNFHIFSYTYEDFDRKFAPDGQQPLYDYFIENEANTAVFIIKGDVGDFTVREFNKAYASYYKNGRPSIVVYNDKTAGLAPSAMSLKTRVKQVRQFWIDYETLNELKLDFQELLSTDLWNLYEKELLTSR